MVVAENSLPFLTPKVRNTKLSISIFAYTDKSSTKFYRFVKHLFTMKVWNLWRIAKTGNFCI